MEQFDLTNLRKLYLPSTQAHKGQNGKLMLIGGSHLFHAASLWALNVASRIVDMVFYASVPENNEIVEKAKAEFRDGIVVPRSQLESYIEEVDAVVIGPGMLRTGNKMANDKWPMINLKEINKMEDEGEQSYWLTRYLLKQYPSKKWVLDAGALQMLDPAWLLGLNGNVILTPHPGEFKRVESGITNQELRVKMEKLSLNERVDLLAREYNCVVLLKGQEDIVCSPERCVRIAGGNAGMTKGGTGDVLAGLVGALACKNDVLLAAMCGSYINKRAGEELCKRMGYFFNASDLAMEVSVVMKELLL